MATIASLVAKIGLDDTDLTAGATRANKTISQIAQRTVAANAMMLQSAQNTRAWANQAAGVAQVREVVSSARESATRLTEALEAATGPSATVADNLKLLAATQGGIAAVGSTVGVVTGAVETLAAAGGVALGGVAVAIGGVAAAAYGLKLGWEHFVTEPAKAAQAVADSAAKQQAVLKDARAEVERLKASFDMERAAEGMTKLEQRAKSLSDALAKTGANAKRVNYELFLQRNADTTAQRHGDYVDATNEAQKLLEAQKQQFRQVGMTDTQKTVDSLKGRNVDPRTLRTIESNAEIWERDNKARETAKQLEEAIAQIKDEERSAGVSEIEQRLSGVRKLLEMQQQLDEQRKQAEHPGVSAAEKMHDHDVGQAGIETKIGELRALLKSAEAKVNAASEATKAQHEADRLKQLGERMTQQFEGPAEHYKRALEDINRLKDVGAISDRTAQQAQFAAQGDLGREMGADKSYHFESPKALVAGSAEAELAHDKSKFENVVAKQQLEEQKKVRAAIEKQVAADRAQQERLIQAVQANRDQVVSF